MNRDFVLPDFDYKKHVDAADIERARFFWEKKCVSGSDYEDLILEEVVALYCYTKNRKGPSSFVSVNNQARNGVTEYATDWFARHIASAIRKIKKSKIKEKYHRFIKIYGGIERHYKEDCSAASLGFTSVSGTFENFMGADCNVYLCFNSSLKSSLAPAYIADLSHYPKQDEYLYLPGARFIALSVVEKLVNKKKNYVVSLYEVPMI